MGVKQIALVIVGAHDGIDDLIVVIAIGVNVTAKVLVRAHDLYHTAEVIRATGIQSRSDAVLSGLRRENTCLDIVVKDVVLILNTDKALDRQAHRLSHQSAGQIAQVGTRHRKHQVTRIHLITNQLSIGPEIIHHLWHDAGIVDGHGTGETHRVIELGIHEGFLDQ